MIKISRALVSMIAIGALVFTAAPGVQAEKFLLEGAPVPKSGERLPTPERFPDFSSLARLVSESVVNISSESELDSDESELSPFLKRDPHQSARSLGSGFIVNEEGFIVTNHHVVQNADKIIVRLLGDKHEYAGSLIGVDEKTDLALVKIESDERLKPLFLGNSDALEVGEWVIAIGNQFQLGHSVTAGIVSAKARRVPNNTGGPYDQFIQTDASINPGSSGGPLVNTRGQVVGINTAIFSPGRQQYGGSGFNIGIGFAIPINQAKRVIRQLKAGGKVTRGLLGVIIQRVTEDIAIALKLDTPSGALVADVIEGSPASKAGFKRKDVIVSFDGHPVDEHDDLPNIVADTDVGKVVEVELIRDGKRMILTPKIQELIDEILFPHTDEERPKPDRLGLVVKEVSKEVAEALGLGTTPSGLGILSVEPGSVGAESGLRRGDFLLEMGGEEITGLSHYASLVKQMSPDSPVLLLVKRKEGTRFFVLKIPVEETQEIE